MLVIRAIQCEAVDAVQELRPRARVILIFADRDLGETESLEVKSSNNGKRITTTMECPEEIGVVVGGCSRHDIPVCEDALKSNGLVSLQVLEPSKI